MEDGTAKLVTIITVVSSIAVGIFSFFSHVNNLDGSRRAEISNLRDQFGMRERDLAERTQRRYTETINRISAIEARVGGVEKTLDRLGKLMVQEYGDLLIEQRKREDSKSKGENAE